MLKVYSQYSQIIDFKNLPSPVDVWTLQDVIGEGTYGEVYLAKNTETGQEAAIKILESIHEVVEEIEEEYLVFRDLNHHANIPEFYGLYLKIIEPGEDQLWIAMELCGGGSVTDLSRGLRREGLKLDEKLIAHILKQTLTVLRYLHDNNVMHRDIKGNNILLTDKGKVKLLDFGVSGHLEEKLSRRKTHVGTPYWMAPEVIACENQLEYNYDIRCDIWSLGVTAIELADGHPPLSDVDPRRALFKIPRNPPPTVKNPSEWSEEFLNFIKTCLVKDFEVRPFTEELLNHQFITQLTDEDIPLIEEKLISFTSKMEREVTAPDVTTKHGQFKSGRKTHKDVQESPDLAKLENLDEDIIVCNLLNRYIQDMIYTYIGDILLALNPFTSMAIYTEEYSKLYSNSSKDENPPHIFAVADQTYQLMMHNKNNQCIVISGESGAGKTESANLLVQQLTQLGKAANRTLEERILQVNPLMEAFGNAKTVINDNSSRFGKYLEMFFTPAGTVIGAKITEYLLEKSRVIYHAIGEQNFHIFYYVHDGLISGENTESYHLTDDTNYRYINEHTSMKPDISTLSVNRVKFKAIQHCFDIIGFQADEVRDVYSILAAILHTGNIEFMERESRGEDECMVKDEKRIETVSKLLGVDKQELIETLTTTGMVAKGEIIIRNNSIQEAINARDAMAKALYGRLFSWIVNRISSLLKPETYNTQDNEGLVIGLLDIFGFENFINNSFEQVCINIANEQIQYYFNQHIFAWEMQEYINEGIDGKEITYVDNRPILDMFLMKPIGLLALLDEESHFPKASDQTLVDKFHQNIKSPVYSRPKADNLMFCIDHYAGRVEYDASGFLEKNRDRLSIEIVNILRTSENNVVRYLFLTPLTKTGNLQYDSLHSSNTSSLPSPVGNNSSISVQSYSSRSATGLGGSRHASTSASMTRIQQTVATYFRYSLMDLLAKMVTGKPHFVRCIKPNDEKDPGHFDSVKVMTQLRYTGVLETTKIRRQGYSHRVPFSDFVKRYQMLAFSWTEHPAFNRNSCKILLERLQLDNWALGKTKVFLKYYHAEQLARLFEKQNEKIIRVQAYVRMFLARTRFYKLTWQREKAALEIQSCFRGFQARKIYGAEAKKRKKAAISVQKVFRGHLARKLIRPQIDDRRKASIAIQAAFRGHRSRKNAQLVKDIEDESARKIQKMFRWYRARIAVKKLQNKSLETKERAAKLIQTYFRMWRCKAIYQQLQEYQSQKEIELIYFSQQVELHGKDLYTEQLLNINSSPNSVNNQMTVINQVPSTNGITEKDIGGDRVEQIKRMSEIKHLVSQEDSEYYDKIHDSKQLAICTDDVECFNPVVVDEIDSVSRNPDITITLSSPYTKERKELMKSENQKYYENIKEENTERKLTKMSEHTAVSLSEGKPAVDQLDPLVLPKSESFSNIPWDAPLQNARESALSASNTTVTDQSSTGNFEISNQYLEPRRVSINIDDDSFTDKNGIMEEDDKYDLANRLAEEVAGSIISLWQTSLTSVDHVVPVADYDDDEFLEDDNDLISPSLITLSPLHPNFVTDIKIEIIEHSEKRHDKAEMETEKVKVESPQTPQTTNINIVNKSLSPHFENSEPSNGVNLAGDDVLVNLRSQLRKTKFDYDNDSATIREPVEQNLNQVDFRSVLKSGRYSGYWN